MAITGKLYGRVMLAVWNKEIDWDSDTITAGCSTSGYTPDQDTHDYLNDITNEVSGGGYSRQTLTGKTTTYTGATNKHVLDASDVTFSSATFTMRTLWLADTTPGTDATRPLIGYQNSDVDITGGGGDLTFVWASAGIVETTVA